MKLLGISLFFITILMFSGFVLADTFYYSDMVGGDDNHDRNPNNLLSSPITPSNNGTLNTIGVNIESSASGGHIQLALYDNDEQGNPRTLLTNSTSVVFVQGWNDLTVSPINIYSGVQYWVGFQQDTNDFYKQTMLDLPPYPMNFSAYPYQPFPSIHTSGINAGEYMNVRINYTYSECETDFQLDTTTDNCLNSTNYEHNTTYYDLNECNVSDLWIMNYTYPELEYSFSTTEINCLNSTDLNTTDIYIDDLSCSYSYGIEDITTCPNGCFENACLPEIIPVINYSCPYLQYHFNNESQFTVFDYSNNYYDATLGGNPIFESGKLGLALKLDAGQYFITNTLTDTAFNYTKPFSISFWFKNLESGRMVLLARIGDAKGWAIGDYYGVLTFGLWSNFDTNAIMVATQNYGLLNDGFYHFVVYTYDGSGSANGMKIYYDNSLQPVDIFSDNLIGDTVYNSSLGSFYGEQQTYGYYDELQIYNFELNQTGVRVLYNYGNGTEQTLCEKPIIPIPVTLYNGTADTSEYLSYYCISNTTLKGNGTYQNQLVETYKTCPYGCIDGINVCSPSDFVLIIFIFLVGIVILWISIWFKRNVLR